MCFFPAMNVPKGLKPDGLEGPFKANDSRLVLG